MKYFIATTLLFFLCSPLLLQAQQHKSCDNILPQYNRPENSVWAMGDSLGLNFNNPGGPAAMASNIYYTGASVADSNGQLLFYTNGMTVWRADGSIMPNGSQLSGGGGDIYGQIIQVVQVPYQPGRYYLFTTGDYALYCNLIDMSMNNGMGEVAWSFPLRGMPLTNVFNSNLALRIAAVPDCSGNAWVLVHDMSYPVFRAFKVTATGIDTVPVVSDFSNVLPLTEDYGNGSIGNMAISPNGRLVVLNHSTNTSPGQYQLACYDFDPATGALSNPRDLETGGSTINRGIGQAAFSPDNSKLYGMTREDTNHLFILQYDLNAAVADSLIEPDSIGLINSNLYLSSLRLGPDGKIYFGTQGLRDPVTGKFGYRAIGRINYPNNPGAACGFQDSVASVDFSALPPSAAFVGFFPTPVVIPQSSLQVAVQLRGDTLFAQPGSYGSYQWHLNGNPLANGQNPYLPITDTGLYAVKVTDTACGCTDSVLYHLSELPGLGIAPVATGQIRIYPNPTHDKIFVAAPVPLNLSLYDLTGRLLRQSKGKNEMDMTGFADGMYLLKMEDRQGQFIKMEKVVKKK